MISNVLFVSSASDPGAFDNPQTWINFGVLGMVVIGFITGWIWTKASVDKLIEERDRLIKERDVAIDQRSEMADILQKQLLPIVQEFVFTTRAILPVLQQLQNVAAIMPKLQQFLERDDRGDRRDK